MGGLFFLQYFLKQNRFFAAAYFRKAVVQKQSDGWIVNCDAVVQLCQTVGFCSVTEQS